MAAPILPSVFEELIILESDTFCVALKKYMEFQVKLYQYMKWRHESGDSTDFSDAYKEMLCGVDCPSTETPES